MNENSTTNTINESKYEYKIVGTTIEEPKLLVGLLMYEDDNYNYINQSTTLLLRSMKEYKTCGDKPESISNKQEIKFKYFTGSSD
tara:strand:- start:25 stop:279 length:255 start_codon:yes stop_codon:yes gene_type:complete